MTPEQLQIYKKKGMKIGKGCDFVSPGPNFGSEPYLIEIGDHTTVSFDVAFVTHDAGTRVLRNLATSEKEKQTVIYGKIIVGNNCFIGCRTTILPGVKIGDNVIIGAGSVVNRDIPSNSVAAGVPCKVICSLEEYKEKHKDDFLYMVNLPYEEKKDFLTKLFKDE
jgi:acetyltransferase-like isoleucine patch superfamily enzyme